MSIIYIAHPISGEHYKQNIENVKRIYRSMAIAGKDVPFAPYLTSLEVLDDRSHNERKVGMELNRELFKRKSFDILGLYGSSISEGMKLEIAWAMENGIKIENYGTGVFKG